ncbi:MULTISPECIES: flagellin [Comamonas]|jgi:flagellin|uniref:Flagellin n=1 Tax=Comamonas terrigena TaxID=32013 RepID=A0A2A7URE8_COMTR|nr:MULTISPECIES: flagellin [Comamonas]MBD9533968.1 Lateral flagellin [Comamonas sp. CMM01]MBV7419399.1 Lateral flagellin [Comamonas sp. CMM03]MDH0049120.1 flagellin [Comamonas terrigena]MDH0512091.1 flagellin [Comamonas terrigena]MDH1091531.1 flagellin [Comamonas terrigena]
MLSLHTNAAALSTQNSLGNTNKALSTSMTRLGTGYRVNSAMDDAAGLQIATRLEAQTRGMSVAQKNTQNGISLLQTGEGALAEVNNMILRMKDLATEAANATSTDADKTAMQAEFTALSAEIDNIMANTKFGGQALFSAAGTFTAASTFQIGASNSETYAFNASTDLTALNTAITNLKAGAVSGTTANAAINLADLASAAVGTLRSSFGAAANRLEHVYNNLGNMIQNTEASKGRIMDVDYATETSNMTSKQMLMQASTAMLKQSSSMSQMVASLLQ